MSSSALHLPALRVLGTGFFAPEYGSVRDVCAGVKRAPVMPPFALVEGRARRFTSLVTQMHLEAAGQAVAASSVDARTVRTIFASAGGELGTAVALLGAIGANEPLSAARFVQSVHNTPSGVFGVATGNTAPSNTIAAGPDTVAAALVEAALASPEDPGPLLVSFGDEAIPDVFRIARNYAPCAVAFVVAQVRDDNAESKREPRLELRADAHVGTRDAFDAFGDFRYSPVAPALAILRALQSVTSEHSDVHVGALAPSGPWSGISCRVVRAESSR